MHARHTARIYVRILALSFIGSLLFASSPTARDVDSRLDSLLTMRRQETLCDDISANVLDFLCDLAQRRQFDSMQIAYDRARIYCPRHSIPYLETILNARKGMAIPQLSEDSLYADIFGTGYRLWAGCVFPMMPVMRGASYPRTIAENTPCLLPLVQGETDSNTILMIEYLTNGQEYVSGRLQSGGFASTRIQARRLREIDSLTTGIRTGGFGRWSVSTGLWIPQGKNKALGTQPELGLSFGGGGKLLGLDGWMFVRGISSKDSIRYISHGSEFTDRHPTSAYFGLDPFVRILKGSSLQSELHVGLGYELINMGVKKDANEAQVRTFNLNVGTSIRFRLPKQTHVFSVQAAYHLLNFKNKGGTDLSGNAITLRLIYSGQGYDWKRTRINTLRGR